MYMTIHTTRLKVTDGKIDRVVPGIWHANRLKLASQMTPDGVIQSEEGLKQYLARIGDRFSQWDT